VPIISKVADKAVWRCDGLKNRRSLVIGQRRAQLRAGIVPLNGVDFLQSVPEQGEAVLRLSALPERAGSLLDTPDWSPLTGA